jgi:hypothetical protein
MRKLLNAVIIVLLSVLFNACFLQDRIYQFQIENDTKYLLTQVEVDFGGSSVTLSVDSFSTTQVFTIRRKGVEVVGPITFNIRIKELADQKQIYPYYQLNQVERKYLDNKKLNTIRIKEFTPTVNNPIELDMKFSHL